MSMTLQKPTALSSPRRVLVLCPNGRGGECHCSYNLSRTLADYGCEVHLIAEQPYELEELSRNFALYTFALRTLAGILQSLRTIRHINPRIIHQQGTNLHPPFEWIYMQAS